MSLLTSGTVCLTYPLVEAVPGLSIFALLVWWFLIVADSAQITAISSKSYPADMVASALAIQNSLGFFLSIGSIVILTSWADRLDTFVVWLLLPGPMLGLLAMRSLLSEPIPETQASV